MKGIQLLTAGMLILPSVAALAQDEEDDLFDEETAETSPDTTADSESESESELESDSESESEPDSELTDSEEQSPPPTGYYAPIPEEPAPTSGDDSSSPDQQEGEEISGFELGFNIIGSNNIYVAREGGNQVSEGWVWGKGNASKIAFQPGWNFGRFGIYLLLGFDFHKEQEAGETMDQQLDEYDNPGAGATPAPGWAEKSTIDVSIFTFDVGLAARIYLLESLRAMSTNLFLEFGIGWRGALVKAELDWKYGGTVNGFRDAQELPGATTNHISDYQNETNVRWNKAAQDYANAAGKRYDGLWANLGIGGEYVFTGGLGVAADAGLHLFFNNEWTDASPYGYDNENDEDPSTVVWEYRRVKWTGTGIDLGLYYSVSLRYHF